MSNFRANIFGILAMLIASIALIISLLPYIPSVLGAPQQQEATSDQQVEAAVVNAIERTFNYQGTLYNQDGTVVESGTYTMTFRIYNAVLEGTVLHEEVKKTVTAKVGYRNIMTSK